MSADRTIAVGEWGHSKVRCNGWTDGHRCTATVTGGFRKGIQDARAKATAAGWSVAVRTQYAPNGYDIRDYCPRHAEAVHPDA